MRVKKAIKALLNWYLKSDIRMICKGQMEEMESKQENASATFVGAVGVQS